jgi:hypothetical protein
MTGSWSGLPGWMRSDWRPAAPLFGAPEPHSAEGKTRCFLKPPAPPAESLPGRMCCSRLREPRSGELSQWCWAPLRKRCRRALQTPTGPRSRPWPAAPTTSRRLLRLLLRYRRPPGLSG